MAAVLFASMVWSAPASRAESSVPVLQELHARIPLGVQGFFVRPMRRNLYLMSTAASAHFEGWKLVEQKGRRVVLAADGSRVDYWPRILQFRVTASMLDTDLRDLDRDFLDLDSNTDLNHYVLGLGFRLKVFHGLQVSDIEPDAVEMLGVPSEVPYDERIYRASFTLPDAVPVDDRLVLEIVDPQGGRLCKFHLEF
jgi:hypothetical protein